MGGAGEVGRSGILVRDSKSILFDYGIKIDGHTEYPHDAGKVDVCVVSHAHLDHSGSVPMLYNKGMPTTIATEPTMQLAELLIEDSMKIHKKKHEHEHFHRAQLKTLLNRYVPATYGRSIDVGEYEISLHDAGHICGSAITLVEKRATGRKIAYTGDFKLEPQLLESGAEVVQCNILVMESTYAGKDHPDRNEHMRKFVDEVMETIDNGGTALIPVFAVGRAQEILAVLSKHGLANKTYLDGMAKAATEIVIGNPEFIKDNGLLEGAMDKVVRIQSRRNRDEALGGGNIILTTSGMLNGGPVLDYVTRLNRNSRIFITGFQVEDTNGKKLVEGRPINIDGVEHRIRTPLSIYDFSAHAGRTDLHEYVKRSNPETVVCVHGDQKNTSLLAEELKLEGFEAYAPKNGDVLSLNL